MNHKSIGIISVCLLLLISFYFRVPYINRPLGDSHEWVTAHALIAIENLRNYPVSKHLFRIISTYPQSENLFLKQMSTVRHIDTAGIGYYTTYPPFSIILPYLIFSIFQISINVINIQIFNIILHTITALVFFLTIFHSTNKKIIPAIVGVIIYIFATPNLWFYTGTYSWDILWFYLIIYNLYFLVRLANHPTDKLSIYALAVLTFFTVYTEFQGLFLAFSIIITTYSLDYPFKKDVAKAICYGAIAALVLFTIQIIKSVSFLEFAQLFITKVFINYGTFGNTHFSLNYEDAWTKYKLLLTPAFLLTVAMLLAVLITKSKKYMAKTHEYVLLVTCLPIIIHTLFMLPDVIIHEFASLLVIILFALFIAFSTNAIITSIKLKWLFYMCMGLALTSFIFSSIKNLSAKYGQTHRAYIDIANTVKKTIQPNEVLFFISPQPITPQVSYYAKRNFLEINTVDEAVEFLEEHQKPAGRIYIYDYWRKLVDIIPITNPTQYH